MIGTLQRIGHGDNMNLNLRSLFPFRTMQEYFRPLNAGIETNVISLINYQPRSRALHETAKQEVHKIIARNHGFDPSNPDSFDEWDTIKTVDQIGKIFDAMNMFLGSVGLVTLALGAIGIINIMLVAVADRTREIGLRKAIGATNNSIMFQFFVEGAFLTLLSGGIGIAGAAGADGGPFWSESWGGVRSSQTGGFDRRIGGDLAGRGGRRRRTLPCPPRGAARTRRGSPQGIIMHRDLLKQAYSAMRHDLRRTLLTMAGMAWGIATVVLLLSYGNGFGKAIETIFESFGATAVGVFPGRTSQQAGGNKAGVQVRFTNDDIELLRNNLPLCRHVVRMLQKDSTVQNNNRSFTFPVRASIRQSSRSGISTSPRADSSTTPTTCSMAFTR